MTQGKIERYHRTMKNIVCLENYYLPGELEQQIQSFVEHYNNERVHESLDNLTPSDVYNGRGAEILTMRQLVKEQTMRRRKRENLGLKPLNEEPVKPQMLRECVS